jgi:hypothetical protein
LQLACIARLDPAGCCLASITRFEKGTVGFVEFLDRPYEIVGLRGLVAGFPEVVTIAADTCFCALLYLSRLWLLGSSRGCDGQQDGQSRAQSA